VSGFVKAGVARYEKNMVAAAEAMPAEKIWLQAVAGNELVRAPDDAHRAVEQHVLLEDFGPDGAGREDADTDARTSWWRRLKILRVLYGALAKVDDSKAGGTIHVLRQPARFRGRPHWWRWAEVGRPLCDTGDLSAVEWDSAANGTAGEVRKVTTHIVCPYPRLAAASNLARGPDGIVRRRMCFLSNRVRRSAV